MRKEFAQHIEKIAVENEKIIFLTGDLGFMALENIRTAIGDRFVNVGVSEQNMITMAASLAYEGLLPICYSIAPFAVFRPAEQIRVDVCLHNLNVKIVGNGGGYGYGIMGATHHALEDIAVLSPFQHMKCFVPSCNEDVATTIDGMFSYNGPSYLRLGYGEMPHTVTLPSFSTFRQLAKGEKITIISMGPVVLNVLKALEQLGNEIADVFILSEIPCLSLTEAVTNSILKTKALLVVEEHVSRGGIGEHLATMVLKAQLPSSFSHLCAHGYENGLYGNQPYHQQINGLDSESIRSTINAILHE